MSMQLFKLGKDAFAVTRPGDNKVYTVAYDEATGFRAVHAPFAVGADDLPTAGADAAAAAAAVAATASAAAAPAKVKAERGTKSIFGVKIPDTQYAHLLLRDYIWKALKAAPSASNVLGDQGKQYWELSDESKAKMQEAVLESLMDSVRLYIKSVYDTSGLSDADKIAKLRDFKKKAKAYVKAQHHWWVGDSKEKSTKHCAGCRVRDYATKAKRHPVVKDADKSEADREKSLRKETTMAQCFARDGLMPIFDPETGGAWSDSRAAKAPAPAEPVKRSVDDGVDITYFDDSKVAKTMPLAVITGGGGGGGGGGVAAPVPAPADTSSSSSSSSDTESDDSEEEPPKPVKRSRGRPKGSKNKNKGDSAPKKSRKD